LKYQDIIQFYSYPPIVQNSNLKQFGLWH